MPSQSIVNPDPLQNTASTASAVPPASAIFRAFHASLVADNEAGWLRLQLHPFMPLFKQRCAGGNWPSWPDTAIGFYDFCTRQAPNAMQLLLAMQSALKKATENAGQLPLPEPVLQVLRPLCSAVIERWVQQVALTVQMAAPELGSSIRLTIGDPWAVYLIACAKLQLKAALPARLQAKPLGLIEVHAPYERFDDARFHKPLADAVMHAAHGQDYMVPGAHSDEFVRATAENLAFEWDTTPLFGVERQSGRQLLLQDPAAQRLGLALFGIHTVEFGAAPDCDQVLAKLENDLRITLHTLNQYLYPQATQESPMTQTEPKTAPNQSTPPSPAPTIVVHGNAIIGNDGKMALASAPGAQAAAGDLHNHGVAAQDLPALLNNFLAQAKQHPDMATLQAFLEQHVATLRQPLPQSAADEAAGSRIKRALDQMENVVKGIDTGGELLERLTTIKNAVLVNCPWLLSLWQGVA